MLRAPCNEYQNAVSVGYSEIGSIRAFLTNENENVNTPYMGIWVHLFTLQEERQKINPRKTLTGVVIIQHTGNNRPKKKKVNWYPQICCQAQSEYTKKLRWEGLCEWEVTENRTGEQAWTLWQNYSKWLPWDYNEDSVWIFLLRS